MLCPDWRDPRNVGSAFRLADAAGVSQLILAGSTPLPPNKMVAKTARSTERSVDWRAIDDSVAYLRNAAAAGHLVLALELTDASVSLFDYQLPFTPRLGEREIILVPGAETSGVPQPILDVCAGAVYLPMAGRNTSMNVAVALGAAVYLLLLKIEERDKPSRPFSRDIG